MRADERDARTGFTEEGLALELVPAGRLTLLRTVAREGRATLADNWT